MGKNKKEESILQYQVNQKEMKDCPHCGRCPICGRGGIEAQPWCPAYPWYPYRAYPYWDTGTADVGNDGVTITFKDDCVYCK